MSFDNGNTKEIVKEKSEQMRGFTKKESNRYEKHLISISKPVKDMNFFDLIKKDNN